MFYRISVPTRCVFQKLLFLTSEISLVRSAWIGKLVDNRLYITFNGLQRKYKHRGCCVRQDWKQRTRWCCWQLPVTAVYCHPPSCSGGSAPCRHSKLTTCPCQFYTILMVAWMLALLGSGVKSCG